MAIQHPLTAAAAPESSQEAYAAAFAVFVQLHQAQLDEIPAELWPSLFAKLINEIFDAGSVFELHKGEMDNAGNGLSLHVKSESGLEQSSDIFLVDHAWTTSGDSVQMRKELLENPTLLQRMIQLMGLADDSTEAKDEAVAGSADLTNEQTAMAHVVAQKAGIDVDAAQKALLRSDWDLVSAIMDLKMSDSEREAEKAVGAALMPQITGDSLDISQWALCFLADQEKKVMVSMLERVVGQEFWRFAHSYRVRSGVNTVDGMPEEMSVWYVNDEVGSAVTHSDSPNSAMKLFVYMKPVEGTAVRPTPFTLLYPTESIPHQAAVTVKRQPQGEMPSMYKDTKGM